MSRKHIEAEHTLLAVVVTIGIRGCEVSLTQASHKRNLPKDSLLTRAIHINMNMSSRSWVTLRIFFCVLGNGIKSDAQLFRLEAISSEIVDVCWLEVGTSLPEPRALLFREDNLVKL